MAIIGRALLNDGRHQDQFWLDVIQVKSPRRDTQERECCRGTPNPPHLPEGLRPGRKSTGALGGGACKTMHRAARNLGARGSLSVRKAEFGAKVPGEHPAFPLESHGS